MSPHSWRSMSDDSDGAWGSADSRSRGEDASAVSDGSSEASESELPERRQPSTDSVKARRNSRRRRVGCKITIAFFVLSGVSIALNLAAVAFSYANRTHSAECPLLRRPNATAADEGARAANETNIPLWQYMSVVGLISRHRRDVVQSAMLVDVALLCFAVSVVTAMIQVVRDPDQLPVDFKLKGTLSNIVQDTTTPVGRLFAVGFFAAGICCISSMYTFTLYRPWKGFDYRSSLAGLEFLNAIPVLSGAINLPNFEYYARVVWVVGPAVGCMFSAAIPSVSGSRGYELAMSIVHNILAPLSLLLCISMESIQLIYGEKAFYYFFRNELTPFSLELSPMQHVRAVCVVNVWLVAAGFFGLQVYIGLRALGLIPRLRTGYTAALLSFYSEVSMCFFVSALPALAGLDTLMDPCMRHTAADLAASLLAMNQTEPLYHYLGAG